MSEVAGILDCSGERRGGDRADAGDRHEKLTGLVLACTSDELAPKLGGLQADAAPEFPKGQHDGRETVPIDDVFDGRKIRVLSIVDNFTWLWPGLDVRFSYPGSDVVEALERIAAQYGRANGPGWIRDRSSYRRILDLWAYQHDLVLDFSRPGKPTDPDVLEKPFQAGAGIFFFERDLARGLVRHRAVKSAYASSGCSTRTRSAARFSRMW